MSSIQTSQKNNMQTQTQLYNPSQNANTNLNAIENPYILLRKMNKMISDQKKQLEEYQIAFQSLQREKQILFSQKKRLEAIVMDLVHRVQGLKNQRNNENSTSSTSKLSKVTISNINLFKNKFLSPTSKKSQYSSNRLFQKVVDQAKSSVFQIRDSPLLSNNLTKRIQQSLSTNLQQYIPQPIRLNVKHKAQHSSLSFINNLTLQNFNKNDYIYGQNMIQTFTIIGPQIPQFKKKRLAEKNKDEFTVKPTSLYCYSKFYKQSKAEFIAQIAKRAFPQGCKLKKKLIQHNQQLLDVLQYKPNHHLSQDYFVFTLKGDESLYKASMDKPATRKTFLYVSNPNFFLYIVCLKLPDFIYIRDQRNYHRKQNEVWIGQKIYAIATYYPFFNIYSQILYKIHEIMLKIIVKKILIDNQNIFTWNIAKSVYDVEKNQQISDILKYFSNKKPDYNQVCYTSSYYFGALPQFGYKSLYSMALYCCPLFFSNFSYQEMLLMLTAIFCQKTLIFLSESQTKATISALFLINLISPFQYSYPLLLNCDSQKVKQMIFQFPFAMICSIKKTDQNIEQILELFAESNIMRSVQNDAQYIVIDVDSNSILYHHVLNKLFNQCIVQPEKQIRQAYLSVNPCDSKSFSLPKLLPRENLKPNLKPKTQLQKRRQQIKKSVKQYMQKICTNQTKIPVYRRNEKHELLLKLLTEYVQQFTLNGQNDYQIISKIENTNKNVRMQVVKNYLLERHKNRGEIINKFLQSQMYANYVDSMFRNS